jgi:hypothetical protein
LSLRWVNVARRLREQLEELDSCLRYDTAACKQDRIEGSSLVEATFERLHFGARYLPRLSLRWRPEGPAAAISFLNDPESGPPFASWPRDDKGTALAAAVLPLGSEVAQRDLARVLKDLAPADRAFLDALLAAMPMVVASAAPNLQVVAQSLQERARRALSPHAAQPSRARMFRKLAGRLRLATARQPGSASR